MALEPAKNDAAQQPRLRKTKVANETATELQAVTVSARQGVESAKDVPFGLSVLRGEEIEGRHATTLEDLLRSAPGVAVNANGGPNSTNMLIRGVGSLNPVGMEDGSVALHIDGVSMSMRSMSLGTLDVDRVEVLKGPQGTLFGGNSIGGAINVTTRKPTRALEGYLRGQYGQDNQHLEEAVISGPLSERLSGRFAIRHAGEDHWVNNAQTGKPVTKPRDTSLRGSLLWELDASTTALLIMEQQEVKQRPSLTILRPYGNPPTLDLTPGINDRDRKTTQRYSAEVNHDLRASRITSITAYTSTDYRAVGGYDRRIVQALYGIPREIMRQDLSRHHVMSQDLRWSSLPNEPIFWVTGVNLSHSDRTFDSRNLADDGRNDRHYMTNNYAAYGEVTYPLHAELKLTAGLRHSWDRKSYDATYGRTATVRDRRTLNDQFTTGRIALAYAWTPTTSVYGVVSRGYEAGGFSDFTSQIADSTPYKPAQSNAAEIGFKSESANRRFALNGALFFTKVRNGHLLGYDYKTYATSTINANTQSKGAELEGRWRFSNGIELASGVSYTEATITSDAVGAVGGIVQAGNRTPDVPRWSGNVALAYRKPLPALMGLLSPELHTRLSYQYVGGRAADPQNHFDLGSYQKVDLHVGMMSGATEVYLYGNNLLNEVYDLYGYYNNATALFGTPVRGRTVGVGLSYYF